MVGRASTPPGQAALAPSTASSADQAALSPVQDASARGAVGVETAQAQLYRQTERLAWRAYLRALRLQENEPGPTSDIIRRATFAIWERAFLAGEVAP